MNAPATAIMDHPVLRSAAGEPPLGPGGKFFRDEQAEVFDHPVVSYRTPASRIAVLELEDGRWLSSPPSLSVARPSFATREAALRYAIARMIRRARKYMRNRDGEGTQWAEGYAGRIIEWALSLKPAPTSSDGSGSDAARTCDVPADLSEESVTQAGHSPDSGSAAGRNRVRKDVGVAPDPSDHSIEQSSSDPIVAALVAAHRARQAWPAGHVFAMTNPVQNGRMVTLGTCSCGDTFSYAFGCYELMDAAIEAHLQKFDHLPGKVDGRGEPISAEETRTVSQEGSIPRRKRRSAAKIAEAPALLDPALPGPASCDAPCAEDAGPSSLAGDEYLAGLMARGAATPDPGSSPGQAPSPQGGGEREAAPIGAGDDTGDDDVDLDDLSIDWPSYDAFLEDKIVSAPVRGIEVARDELHPWLKPHCKDLVVWALRLGCAAIFASFGLHKTAMQLEWVRQLQRRCGGATLNVLPLGVRHGFIKEAAQLGMDLRFVRTDAEVAALRAEGVVHFASNYESLRDGKLDPNLFEAVSLDEASILRSYGSKTFQEFLPLFAHVPFRLVATATPSPNRYKELIHYAGFLGVMDTGLALTRWFQRNSEKAGDLTLYPHKEDEFWMWVHSWAAFLQKPSELGYSDEGYELPPLKLTWHEVPADHSKAEPERDGQGVMFRDVAASLSEAAKARRDSLPARVAKMLQILADDPDAHRLIWHDLEAEREAIEQAVPGVVSITGSGMEIDERERRLADFEEGRTKYFATKPVLSGSGSNFQYHCHKAIYLALPGYGYKFNDFLQSLYRLQRFGQQHPVEIDIIYSEDERSGRAALEEKWARDAEMRARMSDIIRRHGLDTLPLRDALKRTMGVQRVEVRGERFVAINNDAVAECRTWPDASVDQIVTSIPFSNQYEYSPSYNDFGHTDDNGHFWQQMDFLTCELLRMLKPGRLACIHVKDRVLFGAVTGQGVPTVQPFHAEAIMHYRAHGFQYLGMIHVNTDVVRENNQTYRLGWSEVCKDGTKMGVGMPEYVLLLRRPQSDKSRGYADVPVTKQKWDGDSGGDGDGYSRARWQIDAHAFWRSSGNRHLTPEEFALCGPGDLAKLFARTTTERIYDYEAHVKIGERLEKLGTLPATFMAIAPGATDANTWHDVNRMRTLNMLQQRKGAEMHLCLARGSLVLTRDGFKPIEDVAIGDLVLTHRGRWRPVLVKKNTGVRPVVTLRAHGVSGLTLTPDHEIWTRAVRELPWSKAHSRKEARRVDPAWLRADETVGSYVNLKLPPAEQPSAESVRHWWTVGRWLADGHFSAKARSWVISCGHHEVNFLVDQLGDYGGNKVHDRGTAAQIVLRDKDGSLRQTLRACGRGAGGKHLPPEAFTLPLAQAAALLDGYMSGDGHWLPGRDRWSATSVSRALLLGIAMLAQRVHGAIASIYPGRPAGRTTIDGREVATRQEWILSFDVPQAGRFKGAPFVLDDGAWKKVRAVEPAGEAETWCLRVEEDESFTAEGCIVKNCPLQFDIVDRLIERYSNPGELIFDPFGGLMTVPYRALLKGRRGAATELSPTYFLDGVHYLRMAEESMATPELFDVVSMADPEPVSKE